MELWRKQAMFAQNVAKLLQYMVKKGYHPTLGEAFRNAEQAKLGGKFYGESLHCKRLAIDINLIGEEGVYFPDSSHYKDFGVYWENLHENNRWGGFLDQEEGNHFEMIE